MTCNYYLERRASKKIFKSTSFWVPVNKFFVLKQSFTLFELEMILITCQDLVLGCSQNLQLRFYLNEHLRNRFRKLCYESQHYNKNSTLICNQNSRFNYINKAVSLIELNILTSFFFKINYNLSRNIEEISYKSF